MPLKEIGLYAHNMYIVKGWLVNITREGGGAIT